MILGKVRRMNIRSGLALLALGFALSGTASTAQQTAQRLQDAVAADSRHYTVEFENDIVRVLRVREGNGPVSESKAGQVFCGDALSHSPTNVGKALAESIVVEFKNRQRAR